MGARCSQPMGGKLPSLRRLVPAIGQENGENDCEARHDAKGAEHGRLDRKLKEQGISNVDFMSGCVVKDAEIERLEKISGRKTVDEESADHNAVDFEPDADDADDSSTSLIVLETDDSNGRVKRYTKDECLERFDDRKRLNRDNKLLQEAVDGSESAQQETSRRERICWEKEEDAWTRQKLQGRMLRSDQRHGSHVIVRYGVMPPTTILDHNAPLREDESVSCGTHQELLLRCFLRDQYIEELERKDRALKDRL